MSKKRLPKESDLYPIVAHWLERKRKCFRTDINKGLQHGRIDVIGLRDVGGDLSGEIETISVEVKRGTQPFGTASGQALGYKVYANRVYLADFRPGPFDNDEVQIASHLGIGLIRITGKTCHEELSSPYYRPITRMNLALLEKLKLGYCQLCGTLFVTKDAKSGEGRTSRRSITRAAEADRGVIFWNWEIAGRKRKTGVRVGGFGTYERRYLCSDCVKVLAGSPA